MNRNVGIGQGTTSVDIMNGPEKTGGLGADQIHEMYSTRRYRAFEAQEMVRQW